MPVVKITSQGLAAMGLCVALLWACLIGERVMVRKSVAERTEVMRDIRRMQRRQRQEPVSAPLPRLPRPRRVAAG